MVDNVEQRRRDDASDGVGQHEDHHPLPPPQRNLAVTEWTAKCKRQRSPCTPTERQAVRRAPRAVSYLDWVPKICPTTRLETPIPIIWTEVARPMAVPMVA